MSTEPTAANSATPSDSPASPPAAPVRACPVCKAQLTQEAVVCIGCGYDFRIGQRQRTRRGLTVPDAEKWQPTDVWKGGEKPGLRVVRYALRLHHVRLLLYGLVIVILVCTFLKMFIDQILTFDSTKLLKVPEPDAWAMGGLVVGLFFYWLQAVISICASIMCLWTPRESQVRRAIWTSLLADVVAVVLGLIILSLNPMISLLYGTIVCVFTWVLFMLFLQKLAYYLDRPSCGDEIPGAIVLGLLLFGGVGALLAVTITMMLTPWMPVWMGLFLFIGHILIGIGWFIGVMALTFSMIRTLELLRLTIRDGLRK